MNEYKYDDDYIPTIQDLDEEYAIYKDSTYDIISKVAYLIGIPKRIFENENQPPKLEIYERLDKDKNARIIRNLCIVRTSIERGFRYINERMRYQFQSILNMPEYIPQEAVQQLAADGVDFYKRAVPS